MKNSVLIALTIAGLAGVVVFAWYRADYATGLEGFTELTQKDPLFYSAFFETDAFKEGLITLNKSEQELFDVSVRNVKVASERAPLYLPILEKMELFPYSFLELLPAINQET